MIHAIEPIREAMSTMELIMTTGCNLRCHYCYEEKREVNTFTLLQLKELYNVYKTDKLKHIMFFGGEPMLTFDEQMAPFIDYVLSNDRNVTFQIITNGTLFNNSNAKFFKEHPQVNLQISLDGPKSVHDRHRVDANENGSFDRVMDGVQCLINNGVKTFGLHGTLMHDTVHAYYKTYMLCRELQKYSNSSFNIQNIQFSHDGLYDSNSIADFRKCIVELKEKCPEVIEQFESLKKKNKLTLCSAGKNYYTFYPTGTIHLCHRAEDIPQLANYYTGEYNQQLHDTFLNINRDVFYGIDKCNTCSNPLCYFCPMANYKFAYDFLSQPHHYCFFKRQCMSVINEVMFGESGKL